MNKTLAQLRSDMEKISGEWNGDEPGMREERAHNANDVIEKINEIEKMLNYMEGEEMNAHAEFEKGRNE